VEGDARSFRVALVSGELVNPAPGELDALAVLEAEDWGAIQLPAADYPDEVAGPLLDQAAEQAEEFTRHGYRLAVVGERMGLAEALERHGVRHPPQIVPAGAEELRRFLAAASE
jgi:hypothetical protein